VDDAKTSDGKVIKYKTDIPENSVLPEEIKLVQAHLGDLLLKVLMQNEEE
jgi:hypothetical protein